MGNIYKGTTRVKNNSGDWDTTLPATTADMVLFEEQNIDLATWSKGTARVIDTPTVKRYLNVASGAGRVAPAIPKILTPFNPADRDAVYELEVSFSNPMGIGFKFVTQCFISGGNYNSSPVVSVISGNVPFQNLTWEIDGYNGNNLALLLGDTAWYSSSDYDSMISVDAVRVKNFGADFTFPTSGWNISFIPNWSGEAGNQPISVPVSNFLSVGNWTPTLAIGSSTITKSWGRYMDTGDAVRFWGYIKGSFTNSTSSSVSRFIAGLPIPATGIAQNAQYLVGKAFGNFGGAQMLTAGGSSSVTDFLLTVAWVATGSTSQNVLVPAYSVFSPSGGTSNMQAVTILAGSPANVELFIHGAYLKSYA